MKEAEGFEAVSILIERHIRGYVATGFREPIIVYSYVPTVTPEEAEWFLNSFKQGTLLKELDSYNRITDYHYPFKRPDVAEAIEDFFKKGKHLEHIKEIR